MQAVAIVLVLVSTAAGVALLGRTAAGLVGTVRLGQPDPTRTDRPGLRVRTLVREFLGHTRMARLPLVAAAHWFVMVSFGLLFLSLVQAYGQVFDPDFAIPFISHFPPFEWVTEAIAWASLVGIVVLMSIRQKIKPRKPASQGGRYSRFFASTAWQAYYVELTILGVVICVLLLRGLEYALADVGGGEHGGLLHFPLTAWFGSAFTSASVATLHTAIIVVATIKILISMAWAVTIGLQPTMGVAWHRFLAFFNIYFKRHADGRTSLGALQPIRIHGEPVDFEAIEELDEDAALGAGKVEDFTWKGLLDFTTCTECGRCQSQCPAWNTEKPLSPKMLVMALRDNAHAKAPYLKALENPTYLAAANGKPLQAGEVDLAAFDQRVRDAHERPLIGATGYDHSDPTQAYPREGTDPVMDADVIWSCTMCGACVEQCPVDIEHVDHIVDMRRYQVLIESAFPSELGGLFKNLEQNANPWGMSPRLRLDWAKDLPFEVKQVGADVESLAEVEYLFWVGCAGAFEDRQKKTTRAVAELLHTAGVDFAVLGDGEACNGDPARRAGNEFLFQMLAQQNIETLNEAGATKIVVTCPHCFNTLKNEYPQLGGNYEVVHHTQLLNRLVRDKKLVPVAPPAGTKALSVTYHDPCYLGRHNGIYDPPRELIEALPGVTHTEMPRHRERSFCCGAGGARMWMEETLGTRINSGRTAEAVATGADRIAVGCPFCNIMLGDGLTTQQSEGTAREDVAVVDVAQMLLAAVNRGKEPAPSA
jgi:Fe-S oxidoreductase